MPMGPHEQEFDVLLVDIVPQQPTRSPFLRRSAQALSLAPRQSIEEGLALTHHLLPILIPIGTPSRGENGRWDVIGVEDGQRLIGKELRRDLKRLLRAGRKSMATTIRRYGPRNRFRTASTG